MNLDNNKGSALVEMALILPVLLLLVFGIFEFGRAMLITNTLNYAAREGARRATVSPVPINIDAFVRSCISFDTDNLATITTSTTTPTSGSGVPITVTVTLPFAPMTGIIPGLDGITLTGAATMKYEL